MTHSLTIRVMKGICLFSFKCHTMEALGVKDAS